jgi:hypothetical protein
VSLNAITGEPAKHASLLTCGRTARFSASTRSSLLFGDRLARRLDDALYPGMRPWRWHPASDPAWTGKRARPDYRRYHLISLVLLSARRRARWLGTQRKAKLTLSSASLHNVEFVACTDDRRSVQVQSVLPSCSGQYHLTIRGWDGLVGSPPHRKLAVPEVGDDPHAECVVAEVSKRGRVGPRGQSLTSERCTVLQLLGCICLRSVNSLSIPDMLGLFPHWARN